MVPASGLLAKAVGDFVKMIAWELPEGVAVRAVGELRAEIVLSVCKSVVCGPSVDPVVGASLELSVVTTDA